MSSVSRSVGRPVTRSVLAGQLNNLTQLIKSLFANSEQGFAYDPNDLTTLYQDAAGTIPVTAAGQSVGLMLDKSKGLKLGAELFIESDVSIAGQSSKLDGTRYRVYCPDGIESSGIRLMGKFIAGKLYLVEFTIDSVAVAGEGIAAESTQNQLVHKTVGRKRVLVLATNANFYLKRIGVCDYTVSSISVKEIAGNHAYQTVSASRPILQQTPILGNELVVNGNFVTDVSGWAGGNGGVISKSLNGMKITASTSANSQASQRALTLANKVVVVSAKFMNKVSTGAALVALWSSSTGTIGSSMAPASAVEGVLSFTVQVPNGFIGDLILQVNNSVAGNGVEFSDVSVKEIIGYRTDQNYLAFDGVDDFLQTNNIDFTATDKISLFAGVRKLSDTARGVLFELGSAVGLTPGSFGIEAPRLNTANAYGFTHQGSENPGVAAVSGSNYPAPNSAVLVGKGNLSTTLSESIKVNSITTVGPNTALGANTKYGNYPLYIGRRAGTSLPFNGHIYSLIGIGRLTSDSETIALEKAIAKNTGVTLNV